jgi:hypothetical protein
MRTDDEFFEIAGQEVANQSVAKGTMARAFSEALGDKEKTVALYIKYRVVDLRAEREEALRKKAEEKRLAALQADKFEKERARVIRNDRSSMKFYRKTICKQCGYAGAMLDAMIPPDDHKLFSVACKCPRCSHRFDWYYVPSKEMPDART